jgi:uncharacterized membrane protein
MSTLIAIGYKDETTAAAAAEELVRLSVPLAVAPDDVAVVSVDPDGTYQATTRVSGSGRHGGSVFWLALLGALLFEPPGTPTGDVLQTTAVESPGARIAPSLDARVHRLLVPGASALFVRVDDGRGDVVCDAVERYGGQRLALSWGREVPDSAA